MYGDDDDDDVLWVLLLGWDDTEDDNGGDLVPSLKQIGAILGGMVAC